MIWRRNRCFAHVGCAVQVAHFPEQVHWELCMGPSGRCPVVQQAASVGLSSRVRLRILSQVLERLIVFRCKHFHVVRLL